MSSGGEAFVAAPLSAGGQSMGSLRYVAVDQIVPNPHQPRRHFEPEALEDLVSSIKEHGVVEPLIVTSLPDGAYELVAGERRLRSARIAGLTTVPVVVRSATEQEKLELAIIENVQRQDLNPIEEARAYQRLMDEFGLTQEQVSQKMGKSRPQVGNMLRLLQLPDEVQQAIAERKISSSHARTLLGVSDVVKRMELFQSMLGGNFTVRDTEKHTSHPRPKAAVDPNVRETERKLREALGYRVNLKRSPNGSGEIKIGFENIEDLRDIVRKLTRG
jgi:ParB family chromosome partitioning protein